jgi:levansucrase
MIPFHWQPRHLARIGATGSAAPVITPAMIAPLVAGLDIWDHWPVQALDGSIARIAGGVLVIALSAPAVGAPDDRHAQARLRLFHHAAGIWHDLGDLLPNGFSPGSREWAGSAVVDPAHRSLTLYFTAAGRRGETVIGFGQRLFETTAALDADGARPKLWSPPVEAVVPDGVDYETRLAGGGAIGTTKAFRDPSFWRDPRDGNDYLLFAASRAGAASAWNGVIGIARRTGVTDDARRTGVTDAARRTGVTDGAREAGVTDGARRTGGAHRGGGWALCPPLVDATGLNNELERPHIVVIRERIYLFWSTQAKVFADAGPRGPNGLYGVVADAIDAPWRPINGSCLVLRNPDNAPFQAYSWQVFPDGSVWSFADMIGLASPPRDAAEARRHFGGAPAPRLHLRFDGDTVTLG